MLGTFPHIMFTITVPVYPFAITVVTVSLFGNYLFAACVLHQKISPRRTGIVPHIRVVFPELREVCSTHGMLR